MAPVLCPLGRASASTGLKQSADCPLCPAGFFCDEEGLEKPKDLCDAG